MSTPRAKPWENQGGVSNMASATSTATATDGNGNGAVPAGSLAESSIPERPTSLADPSSSMGIGASGAGMGMGMGSSLGNTYGAYGSSRYGGYGSSGMYGSGMSGMYGSGYGSGMYGSSMYGGGYGSGMYGSGYGSSMYGSGYGSGMYGSGMYGSNYGQGGMNGPGFGEGPQATFQLIESIIGAVGGFAQMLEATYMATHSSFFTMVSLAEQFGNLKNALGSLLGIFAIIKFAKKIFYKITGRTYNYGLNAKEFGKFESKQKKLEDSMRRNNKGAPRISFKPLLLFLAASVGIPYLLSKAIQRLNEQQQMQQQRRLQEQQGMGAGIRGAVDADSLEFAKALYEFNPENPNIEIELKPKELVAILSKLDPLGNESKWWKVRSRTGKVGYVPSNFLAIIERKRKLEDVQPPTSVQGKNVSIDPKVTR